MAKGNENNKGADTTGSPINNEGFTPVVAPTTATISQQAKNIKNDRRTIRLEPNPFYRMSIKVKQSQAKTNVSGMAIRDEHGQVSTAISDNPVNSITVPGTGMVIGPALTPTGMATGLDIIVDNPYSDEVVYSPDWGEKILKGKERALLQHVLEYKHGKEYNFYRSDLMDNVSGKNDIHKLPFFLKPECKVTLTGNVVFLNMGNPLHELHYYMLRVHPKIAHSYEDLKEGLDKNKIYYFSDESQTQDFKMKELRKKNKAISIIEALNENPKDIIMMARALKFDEIEITQAKAYSYVNEYIKGSDINYATFIKYYELYNDAARRELFIGAAKLQEYMVHGLIRKRDNKYFYIQPETNLGPMRTFEFQSEDKIINDFLIAPEYADEVKMLDSLYRSRAQNTNLR